MSAWSWGSCILLTSPRAPSIRTHKTEATSGSHPRTVPPPMTDFPSEDGSTIGQTNRGWSFSPSAWLKLKQVFFASLWKNGPYLLLNQSTQTHLNRFWNSQWLARVIPTNRGAFWAEDINLHGRFLEGVAFHPTGRCGRWWTGGAFRITERTHIRS